MANLELDGIEDLIEKIKDLGAKGIRVENKALKRAGEAINVKAKNELEKSKVHRKNNKTFMSNNIKTGKLKNGLKVSGVRKKYGTKFVLVGIQKGDNSSIFYGKFLEYGTSHQVPMPFIAPAYESTKDEAQEIIKQELKDALEL
ncbi:hypothetical protein FDF74_12135 [Clostridium niameyense]|uniref:HK97 gp10 family phage protein n=1 Tax=Clostridium niameyense TaxID=1622073 RepID=A0A6M0RDL4_9CLOT|nr:hypothetical protein [Clostridium niameyense]